MDRIESVDVFRFLAIAAVVVIHTEPFKQQNADALYVFINVLARFAVPFFFVISGYFWGVKIRNSDSPVSISFDMAKKISIILVAWSAFYILPDKVDHILHVTWVEYFQEIYRKISIIVHHPKTVYMRGTKVHLWFLIALLYSLGISTILIRNKHIKTLIALSIALYVFGLLAKAYSFTSFGININFNTRNGPFFGTIFFVSGYLLSGRKPNQNWFAMGGLLFVIGAAMHLTEIYILWKWYGVTPIQDYVVGTYLMGVGAAMAALSNVNIFKNRILSKIGQLTLGIYAIHYLFIDNFSAVAQSSSLLFRNLGYPVLVLFCSMGVVYILSMGKMTRRFVL